MIIKRLSDVIVIRLQGLHVQLHLLVWVSENLLPSGFLKKRLTRPQDCHNFTHHWCILMNMISLKLTDLVVVMRLLKMTLLSEAATGTAQSAYVASRC